MRRLILSSLLLIGLFSTTLYAQCPTSNRPGVHVVKSNQTLYSISRQYNVSVDQLLYWNNMNMNDVLSVCRELKVAQQSFSTAPATSRPATSNVNPTPTSFNTNPATTVRSSNNFAPTTIDFSRRQRGKQHVVQPGETMAYIAALYGYTEYRFREINPIPAGQEVTPGSILLSTDCDCPRTSFNNDLNAFTSSPATSTTTTSRPTSTTSTSPTGNMTTGTFTGAGTSSPTTTNNTTATGTSTNPPSAGSNLPAAPASTNSTAATFMSAIERAMLEEVNLMRSNPKAYIPPRKEYRLW
ncbi:MAG: LysM peptidoglycan-binding domain-containing protein, partial [Bacteroidota bacterium]